jgi:hypothetical protein
MLISAFSGSCGYLMIFLTTPGFLVFGFLFMATPFGREGGKQGSFILVEWGAKAKLQPTDYKIE